MGCTFAGKPHRASHPTHDHMDVNILVMDGAFVPAGQGVIPLRTHAFSYRGTGCFEGSRGCWDEPGQQVYLFRAREHFEQPLRSCRVLHISLPYSAQAIVDHACELVRRNAQRSVVYMRVTAYKTDANIGVRLHVLLGRPIGDRGIGPVGRTIQQCYMEIVRGTDPAFRRVWSTPAFRQAALPVSSRPAGHQPPRERDHHAEETRNR